MQPPNYFDSIQRRSRERWDQLERDPELAGPWYQLFRQVQSPRHVLSELLQNADDAGAKSASVRIEDNSFIFEHDGDDFNSEQFTSICRFGFSNKRTLHTIGFRGIGFKSTFSLGDSVNVRTPTLAVCFKKKRFTEPIWLPDVRPTQRTIVRVRIADRSRAIELRKNFKEWTESPASLLFFSNLKELTIEGNVIKRQPLGNGPVPESFWVKLVGVDSKKLLVIQSKFARLPDESVQEILAERGVSADELHLPPCRVEIVLGLSEPQRLHVVLPTGAELGLPFSCNAPFIQDPARYAIKDPATSPTNRWLLERAGKLAGQALAYWLGNDALALKVRAQAYELLNSAQEFESDLKGTCSQTIMDSMLAELDGQRTILTTDGKLAKPGVCIALPQQLYSVWDPEQLSKLFGDDSSPLLASEVSASARTVLSSHDWLKDIDADEALTQLEQSDQVPRPGSLSQIHALWFFVQSECPYDWNNQRRRRMRIVPVDGNITLRSADEVVRLSSKRDLLSPADWKFVMAHAFTMDVDWLAWISKRAPKKSAQGKSEDADPGYALLQVLALHEPSPVDRIAAQASLRIFGGKNITIADCVHVAHIMAALGAAVPAGFRYVTKDKCVRSPEHGIVMDDTGRIEDLVPAVWAKEHILHEDYCREFVSCSPDRWRSWVDSNASGLLTFAPIIELNECLYNRTRVKQFAASRGAQEPREFHYNRDDFTRLDHGFSSDLMKHWDKLAANDSNVWAGVLEGVLSGPTHQWEDKTGAEIRHNGTRYYKTLNCGFIPAEWIVHFRSVPCLPDTHGKVHTPTELLLRTPDTEPLMGVEPFVRSELDNEATRPLLKLLGVRDTPKGADKLLGRLHALSAGPEPVRFLAEISRIYEALDRIAVRCTPADLMTITDAFSQKALILTDSIEWMTAGEVSIFPDEDNNSPTIQVSLRTLALWPRLGVSERPALGRTIEWLKSLSDGAKLDAAGLRRVRAAIQREPFRIWNECGHWPSLESTWEPITTFQFRLTMQGLMKWGELSPAIRRATANLQMLPVDTTQTVPFSQIRDLGDAVELRVTEFVEDAEETCPAEWLEELAAGLCRVMFSLGEDTSRVRNLARRLYVTHWHTFRLLEVTPYVDGVPAGESFTPKALWQKHSLYVGNFSSARIHKELADELSRPFALPVVSEAIAACIDRNREFVTEYLNSHFDLDPNLSLSGLDAQKANQPVVFQPGSEEIDDEKHPEDAESYIPETVATTVSAEESTQDTDGDAEPLGAKPKPTVPREPTLIERYARQGGFRWREAEKRFVHADGRWIQKSESPFNWEEYLAEGGVVRRLWVSNQRLRAGIEIAAELWSLISQKPAGTGIVVVGDDHSPFPLTGDELLELKASQQITLFPSQYRLVEGDGREPA